MFSTLYGTYFPFNPFPNKPWFLRVCSTSLLKTLWEKVKLFIMSNFSFSHSVFYPLGEHSAIVGCYFSLGMSKMCYLEKGQIHFNMSSAVCFISDKSKILSSGNGLRNVSPCTLPIFSKDMYIL